MDSILPPREWEEDGQLWRQAVSSTPATRLDVINLQEQLDQKLEQRQARETGICQVRRELYAQCFDELIRQCTINCTERGEHLKLTLIVFENLFGHFGVEFVKCRSEVYLGSDVSYEVFTIQA